MKLLACSDLHLDLSPFSPQLGPDFFKTIDVVARASDTTEDMGGLQRSWL